MPETHEQTDPSAHAITEQLPTLRLPEFAESSTEIRISDYLDLWAGEPHKFLSTYEVISGLDIAAHVRASSGVWTPPEIRARSYQVVPRVATRADDAAQAANGDDEAQTVAAGTVLIQRIDLRGSLMKRASSLMESTSTVKARERIRAAANDPEVHGILLVMESPGGTVNGTADLAAEITAARERKPVFVFAEDLVASAAYWAASQADEIHMNAGTTLVGSIGTYIALIDSSKAAEDSGRKVVVFSTGPYKGAGLPGTSLTEDQAAMYQRIVDQTQEQFNAAVQEGRGLTPAQVSALATGEMFMAAAAVENGLADAVSSLEDTIKALARRVIETRNSRDAKSAGQIAADDKDTDLRRSEIGDEDSISLSQEAKQMPETTEGQEPRPASYGEIKAALPNADNDFICKQLEADATVADASAAWMNELQSRLDKANEEAAATAEANANAAAKPGVERIDASSTGDTDWSGTAADEVNRRVDAIVAEKRITRSDAMREVFIADKDLHKAYLTEHNKKLGRPVHIGSA